MRINLNGILDTVVDVANTISEVDRALKYKEEVKKVGNKSQKLINKLKQSK